MITDTIFAKSSAPGKCGVALFRISGPKAFSTIKLLCQKIDQTEPRFLYIRKFYHPIHGGMIDEGMFSYFPAPRSFTGEDVVELYLHGGVAITKIITSVILDIPGVRLAEPGEFTKRAVLNGKIDLISAEGLADLIDAETEIQHRQAIRQFSGELENLYSQWRQKLIKILSLLEAYIDFPEEILPDSILQEAKLLVDNMITNITNHLNDNRCGERLRSGILVSIMGPPNVGKSSLINYLTQREVSIVSNESGTTRDIVETHINLGGYPLIFADTAGIRKESQNLIEQIGIKKAKNIAERSDIKILVFDTETIDSKYFEFADLIDEKTIIALNKIDLPYKGATQNFLKISLLQGIGLENLVNEIICKAKNLTSFMEDPVITRVRYRKNFELALSSLKQFDINQDLVLAIEDIRIASRYLSRILGKIDIDQILDEVFSNFCIGK